MAASLFYNRVKYTAVSAGTVDFVTSAAVSGGFLTPTTASVPNGTVVSYVAFIIATGEWETGQGAYTSGTTTLARTTVRESSNGGSKTNFTAAPTVALDFQAQDIALYAPLANPTFTGTVTVPTPFTLGAVSVTSTGTQLNYLASATGTTGTASTNVVFSTSPSLTTPALGVATATSLAINGATIGSNALAVNGQVTNAGGTITTSQPFTITQTWNAGGVTFNAFLVNATSTASASASTLLDLQVGGSSKFSVDKSGNVAGALNINFSNISSGITTILGTGGWDIGYTSSNAMLVKSAWLYMWSSTTSANGTADTSLSRNAAGVIQFGTTAANAAGSIMLTNITAQTGYTQMAEMTAPAAGASDTVRIYAVDNGAGKTQLMALFSSGAAQQIAIQP